MEVREGTVIHGTLRTDDLLAAFTEELNRLAPLAADAIKREHFVVYAYAAENAGSLLDSFGIAPEDVEEAALYLVNEVLTDALDREAMREGLYFGAHPGDGSNFGFWSPELMEA